MEDEIEVLSLRLPESEGCVVTGVIKLIIKLIDAQFERSDVQFEYQLALIMGQGEGKLDVLFLPCPIAPHHRRFRDYLEHCCKSFQPFMVVQYFEAWTVQIDGDEQQREFEQWKRDNDNELSLHPNVSSKITMLSEHRQGVVLCTSHINENADGKRELGEWDWNDGETTGRLTNLLTSSLH